MLFITHEIAVVSMICNQVAVLNYGEVVEIGDSKKVLENPKA